MTRAPIVLPIAPDRMAFSVSRITTMMLGREFSSDDDDAALERQTWRTAILGIAGDRPLTIAVSADRAVSAALVAELTGCAGSAVKPTMMDDALGELANMTAGQLATELGIDQPLGLPRVVDTRDAFGPGWYHYLLRSDDLVLVVSLVAKLCAGDEL